MKKILIILVLMTIVVGCGKETNNTNTTENSQNITIPDVSGLSLREGQRQLTDAGFVIKEVAICNNLFSLLDKLFISLSK